MKILLNFGNELRKVRKNLGLSQEELADRCGLHRTYIGGIERGERNPTLTILKRISDALDIPLYKLLKDIE